MKVLIVDDDERKRELLKAHLRSAGVKPEEVFIATCAREAREAVEERTYDLLLIDLVLPSSAKSEPRADVGYELLLELLESGCATRVVGTTANLDALATYADEIRLQAEQLLLIDGINEEWRESLRSLILQIRGRSERPDKYGIDFCLLTAVRSTEYGALSKLPIPWGAEKVLSSGGLYRQGSVKLGGVERTGLCAHSKQMGMVSACHLTQTILNEFRPRVVIMTGICGGLPGETNLGDLVIADKSWDWQSGKYTADRGFVGAPDQKEASPGLVAHAKAAEMHVEEILKELVSMRSPGRRPKFVDGPMLSGSAVVASDELHKLFVAQHRKPIAVEMECYGVYYACRMAGIPAPEFLCMKAVSDLTDATKADDYQEFCSSFSARVALKVLERHFAAA